MTPHQAHYHRIYPRAGTVTPRTIAPATISELRDRVQVAELRARAYAVGTSIRSRHHGGR
jgi:hypothetical protein